MCIRDRRTASSTLSGIPPEKYSFGRPIRLPFMSSPLSLIHIDVYKRQCLAFAAVTTIGVYQLATGEKNGITDILMTVFALFAVIYFAYIFINGGSPAMGSGMHLCLIGPIGFSVVRLTVDFNQLTMNANVSGYRCV